MDFVAKETVMVIDSSVVTILVVIVLILAILYFLRRA